MEKTKENYKVTEIQRRRKVRNEEIVTGYLKSLNERGGQGWIRCMEEKYGLSHATISSIISRNRNKINVEQSSN